jgi:hypothetical protein
MVAGAVASGVSIAAGQITAGTLVAGVVYAGAIACSQLQAGTISAAISLTSPTITVTSGTVTINIDATHFLKVSDSSTGFAGTMNNYGVYVQFAAGNQSSMQPSGFSTQNAGGTLSASVQPGQISVSSSGGSAFFAANGNSGFTGTLAAAIAAGRNVSGGIIV